MVNTKSRQYKDELQQKQHVAWGHNQPEGQSDAKPQTGHSCQTGAAQDFSSAPSRYSRCFLRRSPRLPGAALMPSVPTSRARWQPDNLLDRWASQGGKGCRRPGCANGPAGSASPTPRAGGATITITRRQAP